MRVRTGSTYFYDPNGWDRFRPCQGNTLERGAKVKVINLPSAPKANTMGQCYVADPETGKFICMVSTNSLTREKPMIETPKGLTECACGGTGIAPSIDPENEDGYEPCPDCPAGVVAKALRGCGKPTHVDGSDGGSTKPCGTTVTMTNGDSPAYRCEDCWNEIKKGAVQ